MFAVARSYTGATPLIDAMQRKTDDVRAVLAGIDGFVAYYALRDGGALTAVAIYETRTGAEESTRAAASWVKQNVPGVAIVPTDVRQGEVFLAFGQGIE